MLDRVLGDLNVGGPIGPYDQRRFIGNLAGQMGKQRDGGPVRPVQIVDEEQDGMLGEGGEK